MNIGRCQGCGIEKDCDAHEVYTHPETDRICTEPIPPLCSVEVQSTERTDGHSAFRSATVCFECFHRLDPDMWISQEMWEALKPVVSYDDLPVWRGRQE